MLVHVIEPVRSQLLSRHHVLGLDSNRWAIAEDRFEELVATLPRQAD